MSFKKITEQTSNHQNLDQKSVAELLLGIHQEDQNAVKAVGKVLSKIELLIQNIIEKKKSGGRLFYIGAGTSGRLGVLDASECPPTFGTKPEEVIGIIAGGDLALRKSIENAEDDSNQAWKDLNLYNINKNDFVIGIAASGTTPYVVYGLKECQFHGIPTGCITCNEESPLAAASDYPIEVVVGPEYLTGSSRMKAGTVQKLILNMITTSTMIKLGHVRGNVMIDMKLSNEKLVGRAEKIIMDELNVSKDEAKNLLKTHNNIRDSIKALKNE